MAKYLLVSILFIFNTCTISAQNQRSLGIISAKNPFLGTTRAVIVGVSEYKNLPPDKQLNYADDDAVLFGNYLLHKYGNKASENIRLLTNKDATAIKIKEAVSNLIDESSSGDQLIIYFAGHGDVFSDSARNIDDAFLLCHNVSTDADYSLSDAISLKSLQELIASGLSKGLNIILITDACRSGKYATTQQGALSTAKILAEKWNKITRIASCQEDEVSYEDMKWGGGHGAFTYYFIEGLKGNAKNSKDSLIRLADLENYMGRMLVEATDYKQNPVIQGDKKMIISKVDTINFSKPVKIETLLASRSTENNNISNDTSLNSKIEKFKLCIESRKLILPADDCAYDIYKEISKINSSKKIIKQVKGTLVVALQQDAQKVIDIYLSGSANQPSAEKFAFAAKELEYAVILLGKNNSLAKQIIPKQYFLEGFSIVRGEDRLKYKQAEELLKKSLNLSKKSSYVYNGLGRLYLDQDKLKESEKCLRLAIDKAPRWTLPKSNLGLFYRRKNLWQKAISIFSQTINIDTSFSWGYNNLGCVYIDMGKYKDAGIMFKKASSHFPDDPIPLTNCGYVAENQGRSEEAKLLYLKALDLDSNCVTPYQKLGNYYNSIEKIPELSEKYYKKAIEKEPFFEETYYYLANFYSEYDIKTEQFKKALPLYKKAYELNPYFPNLYLKYGYYYFKMEDTNTAKKIIMLGVRKNKNSPLSYNYLARYYEWIKDNNNAEKNYFKSLAVDSMCIWTYLWMGDFYEKSKQTDKAELIKRKACIVFNDSPEINYNLANFFFNKNETDSAVRWYEKTIIADPNYSYAYSSLAYIYLFRKNDPQKSLRNFEIAKQLNPVIHDPQKFAELLKSKGDSLSAISSENKKAIGFYKSAIELDSNNMAILAALGKAYYLNFQTSEAIIILQKGINKNNISLMIKQILMNIYAKALLDEGNYKKALDIFNEIIDNTPLPSYLGKAIALYYLNDISNSIKFYKLEKEENPNLITKKYIVKNFSSKAIYAINQIESLINKE